MNRIALTDQSTATGGVDVVVEQIHTQVNALLTLSATGGTVTADGTEQTLVLVSEPLGIFNPVALVVDLDAMQGGDTIVVKVYHRLSDGGGLQLFQYATWTGVDGVLANGCKVDKLELYPNRHGYQITLQQTAGVNRSYPWEFFVRV